MAKKEKGLLALIMWIVGVLVSLAVGNGMIEGVLSVPLIPGIITVVAGWIVVIGAVVGVIMALVNLAK